MNNIIIIVPVLNEKRNIEILFKKLNTINIGYDLLFIDDNSSDGSREIIKNLAKNNQNINYILRGFCLLYNLLLFFQYHKTVKEHYL